jgi:hypothetical protein
VHGLLCANLAHEFNNLEGQTEHWIQCLQEYNFTSDHRQGQKHNAIALPRRPCQEQRMHCHKVETWVDIKKVQAIAALPTAGWDLVALRTEQLNDSDIGPILQEV